MPNPRKPTNVHALTGSGRHNKSRIEKQREGEPVDDRPIGNCPTYLAPAEKKAWLEIVDHCITGVLKKADRIGVESAARLVAKMREQAVVDDERKTVMLQHIDKCDFSDPSDVQSVMYKMARFYMSVQKYTASDQANLRTLLGQFGMLPADRSKVKVGGKPPSVNPFAEL